MTSFKLGKLPAAPELCKLRLSDYFDHTALPTPPENFGHETLVTSWGMLGNGQAPDNPKYAPNGAGNCGIAGPYHALTLWNLEAGKHVPIDTETVLKAYSEIAGYDPKQYDPDTDYNPTDNGSNVNQVAAFWSKHGLPDSSGAVHKVSAYLALDPGDIDQLWQALYLFDGVGIGIAMPEEWQLATQLGQVWDVLDDPTIAGGHYVLGVGRRGGNLNIITWGQTQLMTPAAYQAANDETLVYFSEEKLLNGKSIDGFDRAALIKDLQTLAKDSVEPLAYITSDIGRWDDDGGYDEDDE